MHLIRTVCLTIAFAMAALSAAASDGRATLEEARAMAERAAELVLSEGRAAAFEKFDNQGNGFHDRDLYVFVWDDEGKCLSHGANPSLIGRNFINLRDVNGRPLIQDFTKVETAEWVSYKWRNPLNNRVEAKQSYIIRVDDILVGVGAHTP